jgi:hypothetical protein
MRSSQRKVLIACLAIGILASCQDASGPGSHDYTGAPLAARMDDSALVSGEPVALRVPNPEDVWGWGYIEASGGKIRLEGHEVLVPNGAVSERTLFVIRERAGEFLVVDLMAFRDDGLWTPVTTFPKPVKLKLSYKGLAVKYPKRLTILYLPDDELSGEKIVIPTAVSELAENMVSKLDHFSSYAAGIN